MNALAHLARAYRLQAQAHAARSDYETARGNPDAAAFFKHLADSHLDYAAHTEVQAELEAAE